jgi:hypothetical protein
VISITHRMLTYKIKEDEMGGACSTLFFEGARPLGSPGRRWEDNIKMDLRETDFRGTN